MRLPAGWQVVRNRFPRWAGPVSAVVMVTAGLAVMVLWRSQQIQVLSVQSGSMAPVLHRGDAVVVRRVAPDTLRAGDMVSYLSPADPAMVVTHRVVSVDRLAGRLVTRGDANTSLDPAVSVHAVLGRVRYAVPGLGYAVDVLRSWPGLVAAVYLPAAVLLTWELRRLAAHYLRPTYVLRGRS